MNDPDYYEFSLKRVSFRKNYLLNRNDEFIPYKEAFVLKQLGFDKLCLAYKWDLSWKPEQKKSTLLHFTQIFNIQNHNELPTRVSIPTWRQAFKFFREKYRLDGHVTFRKSDTNKIEGINKVYYDIEIYRLQGGDAYKIYRFNQISDNKEKAELACLKRLIEIVKNQNECS